MKLFLKKYYIWITLAVIAGVGLTMGLYLQSVKASRENTYFYGTNHPFTATIHYIKDYDSFKAAKSNHIIHGNSRKEIEEDVGKKGGYFVGEVSHKGNMDFRVGDVRLFFHTKNGRQEDMPFCYGERNSEDVLELPFAFWFGDYFDAKNLYRVRVVIGGIEVGAIDVKEYKLQP